MSSDAMKELRRVAAIADSLVRKMEAEGRSLSFGASHKRDQPTTKAKLEG